MHKFQEKSSTFGFLTYASRAQVNISLNINIHFLNSRNFSKMVLYIETEVVYFNFLKKCELMFFAYILKWMEYFSRSLLTTNHFLDSLNDLCI